MTAPLGAGPAAHRVDPGESSGSSRRGDTRQLPASQRAASQRAASQRADPAADLADEARAICLRLLDRRPRTRFQLATALRRRGVPAEVATDVLDRLTAVGLVDDVAYATEWVRSRHAGRGLARRALADELRRRGVQPDTVQSALSRLDSADEEATARLLAERRLAATRGLPDPVRVRRVVAHLVRRGYPAGLAQTTVQAVVAASADCAESAAARSPGEAT